MAARASRRFRSGCTTGRASSFRACGPNSTRRGTVRFTVDAFSADDPFDPRRAEARSSIPGLGLGDAWAVGSVCESAGRTRWNL